MRNKLITLCLLLLFTFQSCQKAEETLDTENSDYRLEYKARSCSKVFAVPGEAVLTMTPYYTVPILVYNNVGEGATIFDNQFILAVYTSNFDLGYESVTPLFDFVDAGLPVSKIEESIYNNMVKSMGKKPITNIQDSKFNDINFICIEYRTTGIKKFNITSPEVKIFNKAPGESLNSYFEIKEYDPRIIISSESNTVLYSYCSPELPRTINDWLLLKPMAQPIFYFELAARVEDPVTTRFKVEIETVNGDVLSYTTKSVTLTAK